MVTNEIRPDCRIKDASASPPSVETELVALRIAHRDEAKLHPPLVGLYPVGASRTESLQTVSLGLEGAHPFVTLEARNHTDIEVEPVLDGLALGHALEEDARMWTLDGQDRRAGVPLLTRHAERFEGRIPGVECAGRRLHLIVEHLGPEGRQPSRIGAVERDLHFVRQGSTLARTTDRWCQRRRIAVPRVSRSPMGRRPRVDPASEVGVPHPPLFDAESYWVEQEFDTRSDMSTVRSAITGPPEATSRQRTPSAHRNVASQIKHQRRLYARAVLRALARTQQGQPTAHVHRVLRQALTPLGVRLPAATLRQLAADITAGRPVDLA
jgi:hypothetical protein